MDVKSWKTSIVLWVNFASVALVAALSALELVLPAMVSYLPGGAYAAMVIALAIINAVLRAYKTYQPLDTNQITK